MTEEKITKIVDESVHSRGVSVEQVGGQGALITKVVDMPGVTVDTTGLATDTNQTNGSQKTQIVDAGGEAVTVTGGKLDVNATASLAGEALPVSGATTGVAVAIVDGSGNQITSFGGGTQYTEGDTDATITGTAALVEGAANALNVLTQPLTDTQLRASAVPVSATNLDIRPLVNTDVVTAELSATDNAVLDTIAAKDFATQTTLAAIKDTDGIKKITDNVNVNAHAVYAQAWNGTSYGDLQTTAGGDLKVTLDGESTVVTATDLDIRPLVNTDVVTAELSAVDNAVLDDVAAKLGTIGADTSNVSTKIDTLAGAVSGTEVQVDVLTIPSITGTVTANAGTNLNTSALALETGGNLAAAATSLGLLDNSVDGNYLNVNMNVAGTDVVSGSGTATGALRVELPTNGTGVVGLNAGTNLVGKVSSADRTDAIYNDTTALTPKFAAIDVASSGNNTIVAAVTSKKIRVLSLFLVSAGTVNVRFESGADGTALSGQMNLIANTGFVLPYNPVGWFESASGVLLNLELSGAVSVDGSLTYIEV